MAISPNAALRKVLADNADVSAIVSTRIYPVSAPQGAVKPYGTVTRIDQVRERHMTDASGLARARVQVDWYGLAWDTVHDMMEKARLAADTWSGVVVISGETLNVKDISIQNEIDDFEVVTDDSGAPVYRGSQDYFVWFNPAITNR